MGKAQDRVKRRLRRIAEADPSRAARGRVGAKLKVNALATALTLALPTTWAARPGSRVPRCPGPTHLRRGQVSRDKRRASVRASATVDYLLKPNDIAREGIQQSQVMPIAECS